MHKQPDQVKLTLNKYKYTFTEEDLKNCWVYKVKRKSSGTNKGCSYKLSWNGEWLPIRAIYFNGGIAYIDEELARTARVINYCYK